MFFRALILSSFLEGSTSWLFSGTYVVDIGCRLSSNKCCSAIDFIIEGIDALFCGELTLVLLLNDRVNILYAVFLLQEFRINVLQLGLHHRQSQFVLLEFLQNLCMILARVLGNNLDLSQIYTHANINRFDKLTIIVCLFLGLQHLRLLDLPLELLHLLLYAGHHPLTALLLDLGDVNLHKIEYFAVVRVLVHHELLELPERRDLLLALVKPFLECLKLPL